MPRSDAPINLHPQVADEVKTTTCYMCACRCGIRVYLKDGQVRYIEGNPDHPVNRGVLCAKGSAGIMNHYAPGRLQAPLRRVGPRGSGEFEEISWDEALSTASRWLGAVRARDPKKLAFFTGRDQSQSFTGWWAAQFGTPNFAAHGGFCSVNMAAGGLYTLGGAFWEFGEPDWDRTRYFMLFGVAEDHDSNPIKIGLGKLRTRSDAKFVSVNPVRTGYSALADEWIAIKPGTDGLLICALIGELLRHERVDFPALAAQSNACWLVADGTEAATRGLFVRDSHGDPVCFDIRTQSVRSAYAPDVQPAFVGAYDVGDGRTGVPVFEKIARRYLSASYTPERVAPVVGLAPEAIRRLAAELATAAFDHTMTLGQPWVDWQGREHTHMPARPVAFHAMRGISAHANGFQTCRALHLLQALLGAVDAPGGWLYKPPFPKPAPPGPRPAGKTSAPMTPLNGMPLGNPLGPEDLLVDTDGNPLRLDKAYSWEYPLAAHGLMHMVLHNAWAQDPYGIDVLMMYMSNMSWNSAMNVEHAHQCMTDKNPDGTYKIPAIIYADAYASEMVAYADLVLPDTTYLERWDCMSLLDRPISSAHGPADAIRQPVCAPERDVRPFQDVLLELGHRLGLPGMTRDDGQSRFPGGYADYLANHQRGPGLGPLAGWRGEDGTVHGRGAPNPQQLQRYQDNGCFWKHDLPPEQRYFRHINRDYLAYAHAMGWIETPGPILFQLYSETLQKFALAAQGVGALQPPDEHRARLQRYCDPLPFWYEPFESAALEAEEFPLHAITQRPMHMYHSWGSQNAWLRQITADNRLYIHADLAQALGVDNDDWVWIISRVGRIKGQVRTMQGVQRDTVWTWNAIGKRARAWGLDADAPEATRGFLLNHLISELLPQRADGYTYANADPVTGQAAWYDLRVRLEKCSADAQQGLCKPPPLPAFKKPNPDVLRFGASLKDRSAPEGQPACTHTEWIANRREHQAARAARQAASTATQEDSSS